MQPSLSFLSRFLISVYSNLLRTSQTALGKRRASWMEPQLTLDAFLCPKVLRNLCCAPVGFLCRGQNIILAASSVIVYVSFCNGNASLSVQTSLAVISENQRYIYFLCYSPNVVYHNIFCCILIFFRPHIDRSIKKQGRSQNLFSRVAQPLNQRRFSIAPPSVAPPLQQGRGQQNCASGLHLTTESISGVKHKPPLPRH